MNFYQVKVVDGNLLIARGFKESEQFFYQGTDRRTGEAIDIPAVFRECARCGKAGNRGRHIDEAHTKDMAEGWTIIRHPKGARFPSFVVCPYCSKSGSVAQAN